MFPLPQRARLLWKLPLPTITPDTWPQDQLQWIEAMERGTVIHHCGTCHPRLLGTCHPSLALSAGVAQERPPSSHLPDSLFHVYKAMESER